MSLSFQQVNTYTGKSLSMEAKGTLTAGNRSAQTTPPDSAVIVSLDRLAELSK